MASKISLPNQSIVCRWKEEKVIRWLRKVNLEDCIPAFENRHIDGVKLLELSEQKLFLYLDLKIKHRKQIAKCVQECKSQATNAKRIAKNLKNGHASNASSNDTNDGYEYDYDSDDWGSDFEDSDDEVKDKKSFEVNNNSLSEHDPENHHIISEVKSIPKPPDIPVVSKAANGSTGLRNATNASTVSRPLIKRPPSQPPPPPTQVPSQEEPQEEYEIPIASSSTSCKSICFSSSSSLTSNDASTIETYELIDPPDENYEIVDSPMSSQAMSDKPNPPPRPVKSRSSPSPPPLPQKPPKLTLKDSPGGEVTDGCVRTFCRPKLPIKTDSEAGNESNQSPAINIGIIGALMGRRPSYTTPTSSPKNQHLDKSSMNSPADSENVSKKNVPLPPLPQRGTISVTEESVQSSSMATRPLPPVPSFKEEDKQINNNLVHDIKDCPWFHELEREEAETTVKDLNESGSFVVRPSKRAGKDNPYSLTVLHEGKLFHLNIRQRSDNTFALGKEKEKEKTFPTVLELIAFHQNDPILLKNKGEAAGRTILKKFPAKR